MGASALTLTLRERAMLEAGRPGAWPAVGLEQVRARAGQLGAQAQLVQTRRERCATPEAQSRCYSRAQRPPATLPTLISSARLHLMNHHES
jgi:hypothetical protein